MATRSSDYPFAPAVSGARWPAAEPRAAATSAIFFGDQAPDPHVLAAPQLPAPRPLAERALRRALDLALASLALLVLAPVMLLAAALVKAGDGGPVFYAQPRFGRHGRVFGCLKFRTMRVDSERLLAAMLRDDPNVRAIWERQRKLVDDPRVTRIGRVLRRYSLDELPQLFNVLKGEMALVGPRPLATDEAHFYDHAFPVYCAIRPGITGPWQIGGRNSVSFANRARMDCDYAHSRSLAGDARILFATIPVVLRGTGF